jgi:hypothetical protein
MSPSPLNVPGRFIVEALTRTPRLSDYSQHTHRYLPSYVRPPGYTIAIDAFPGKRMMRQRGDQQLPSGGDRSDVKDIWKLACIPGTTGWRFHIEGRTTTGLGRPGATVSKTTEKHIATLTGVFDDDGDDNAWNFRALVPAPGDYEVTVTLLNSDPAKNSSRSQDIRIRDYLVASIGDSAASGEGNPDVPGRPAGFDAGIAWYEWLVTPVAIYKLTVEALDWVWEKIKKNISSAAAALEYTIDMDPEPVWAERHAHRSFISAFARACVAMEDRRRGDLITHIALGRSGSAIEAGLIGPRSGFDDDWIDNLGQIEELRLTVGRKRIDALLVFIGINEVDVSGTLSNIVSGDMFEDDTANRRLVEQAARDRIADFPRRFDLLENALRALDATHVYFCEYPTGLFNNRDGVTVRGCGIFDQKYDMDLTRRDAQSLTTIGADMNAAVREQVDARKALNWHYIDGIAAATSKNGYCVSGDRRMFIQAEESLGLQGDTNGTVHPNQAAIAVMAPIIAAEVSKRLSLGDVAGTGPSNENPSRRPDRTGAGRPGETIEDRTRATTNR